MSDYKPGELVRRRGGGVLGLIIEVRPRGDCGWILWTGTTAPTWFWAADIDCRLPQGGS